MFRFFMADDTFKSLNIPISPNSRREMERKIRKGEMVDPIISWKGYILTGYEQDDLYLKYHRNAHVFSSEKRRYCVALPATIKKNRSDMDSKSMAAFQTIRGNEGRC